MKNFHYIAALALVATTALHAQIVNLSYRSYVGSGTGESTLSFTIPNGAPEQVLVRAMGPTRTSQGLSSASVLADPALQIYAGSTLVAANDNWGDNASPSQLTNAIAQVGAQPFAGTDTTSAALLLTLAPGTYRVRIYGTNGTTGIALPEVYAGPAGGLGFNYVSAESIVSTGNNVLIGGVVINRATSSNLLIRALGPALGGAGVTSDPTLEVHDALHSNSVIGQNDNWSTNSNAADIAATASALGLTTLAPGSADSALLQSFQPGVYSFLVSHSASANDGLGRLEIADATAIPEPGVTAMLAAVGALGLALGARRRVK